jgi:hypothetical protein
VDKSLVDEASRCAGVNLINWLKPFREKPGEPG